MDKILVVLEDQNHNKAHRAKVDAQMPVSELVPAIARALGLPTTDATGRPQIYRLAYNGRRLQDDESLTKAQVTPLDTITIVPEMVAGSDKSH